MTFCDYVVAAPTHQDQEEAEAADEALAECAENGTCDVPSIENVETGAHAEKSFSPSYEDHPEECAERVTAADSMPLPSAAGG